MRSEGERGPAYKAVKPPWPGERWVQNFVSVSRAHHDYSVVARVEAVHARKHLVERQLDLVVRPSKSEWALLAKCIQLVDKDDARRSRRCLFEERAHACRTAADEELYKVRAWAVEERHLGLRCHHTRKERLSGPGWPNHENTRRQSCARSRVLVWIAQHRHDFADLSLGGVHTSDIVKGEVVRTEAQRARFLTNGTCGATNLPPECWPKCG
jgi:hypothetical protein